MTVTDWALIVGGFSAVVLAIFAAARWIFKAGVNKLVDSAISPLAVQMVEMSKELALTAQVTRRTADQLVQLQAEIHKARADAQRALILAEVREK